MFAPYARTVILFSKIEILPFTLGLLDLSPKESYELALELGIRWNKKLTWLRAPKCSDLFSCFIFHSLKKNKCSLISYIDIETELGK